MPNELQGRRIAFLATYGVEQVELEQPRAAVQDAAAMISSGGRGPGGPGR